MAKNDRKIEKVRTRFAPSPTGNLHIGGLRTAIYAYALAKHSHGDFILRIEDTDQKREVKGAVDQIKDILKLFGLVWDDFWVQSERVKTGVYKEAAEKLISLGKAFYCECESKNSKKDGYSTELRDPCRNKNLTSGAIKLKVPEGEVVKFKDYVLNREVEWDTSDVADATLLKSDGFPTYHLAVVVDDHDMKISHVLRGHDWMPSTPIHLLAYKYLDFKRPEIGHLTDILDPEGGKLSKRKGSVSVKGLLEEGFLPSALANFVILLGWAPKDNREIFSLKDFVEDFDPRGFQKSNPVFNREKLIWFNGEYLRKLSIEDLYSKFSKRSQDFEALDKDKKYAIAELLQTRVRTLDEFDSMSKFFFKKPKYTWDIKNGLNKKHLKSAISVIESTKNWNVEALNKEFLKVIDDNGYKTGEFFMSLRIAITGEKFTPPITESILILGKDEAVDRIKKILN